MLKQTLLYLFLSIAVVFLASYVHVGVVYIDFLYTYVNLKLAPIFSNSELGILIRNIIALSIIPLIIVGIPALLYRAIKKKTMPYLIEITWFLWLIIVLSKVLIH
jgi:hypothetical protein